MIYNALMARYNGAAAESADKWAALMSAIGALVVSYGNLPRPLQERLEQVNRAWRADGVDPEFLRCVKHECWEFLQAKHGNSTAIVDREDRAVRAMLGLLEPAGDDIAASDTASWVEEMLRPAV
jgi:hypothetical protein